jgi:hypothetical protein
MPPKRQARGKVVSLSSDESDSAAEMVVDKEPTKKGRKPPAPKAKAKTAATTKAKKVVESEAQVE